MVRIRSLFSFGAIGLLAVMPLAAGCGASNASGGQGQASKGSTSATAATEDLERSLDALAAQIVEKLSANKVSKVGVNEFLTLKGEATDLGKFMAEELTTRLINSGRAQVVERRLLQKVLSEQEIGASQLVDDETAARIGKLLGADTLCVGTMTDLGQSIKVNARLINAETAEVYGAASVDIPKNRAVMALLMGAGGRPAIVAGPAEKPEKRGRGRGNVQPAPAVDPTPPPEPAHGPAITSAPAPHPQAYTAPAAVGPSAATPMSGPDPNDIIVFVRKPVGGEGPDTVRIHNKSRYCIKLWLNGKAVRLIDRTQEVPCIPDGEKSFLKIASFGEYRLQASGSSSPNPFSGIVGYDKKHMLSPQQKKQIIVLQVADFYSIH